MIRVSFVPIAVSFAVACVLPIFCSCIDGTTVYRDPADGGGNDQGGTGGGTGGSTGGSAGGSTGGSGGDDIGVVCETLLVSHYGNYSADYALEHYGSHTCVSGSCGSCNCQGIGGTRGKISGVVCSAAVDSDPKASFAFGRSDIYGKKIGAGTKYWLAAIDPSEFPSYDRLHEYDVIVNGLFGTAGLQGVNGVSVWGSKAAHAAAPRGDKKCFFLITDDLDHLDQKLWFQPEPICFTKTC